MQPGIYRGIAADVYHAGREVSKHLLDLFARAAALYHGVRTGQIERKTTKAKDFGTAFHALILEPAEFVRGYCLALQRSDVPHAIDERETLVAMVSKLNEGRKAKLSRTGSKPELVERIMTECSGDGLSRELLDNMPAKELQGIIDAENTTRLGLLPVSGTRHELAKLLRDNGVDVTLWSDVVEEWERNNGDRLALSVDDWNRLHNMRAAIEAHPFARALLMSEGASEVSAYWRDPVTGRECRARADRYQKRRGYLVDLKSCEDASEDGFAGAAGSYRYFVQDPWYIDGFTEAFNAACGFEDFAPPKEFLFVAVEKSARVIDGEPLGVAVYRLDDEDRILGRMEYRALLDDLVECERAGKFEGYAKDVRPLTLRGWLKQQLIKRHANALAAA